MFRLLIFSCLFLAKFAYSNSRARPSDERVVGGNAADITEVPYQVSVQYNGKHLCGGSIIGAKHILSAAHCFEKKKENLFSIRAGSSHRYRGGQLLKVAKIICHPDYNTNITDYDAAVLELEDYLRAAEGVEIANLAHTEPTEGDMALISGWGAMQEGIFYSGTDILQSVSVPVVSRKFCQEKYVLEVITEQMFCAGYPEGGKDSCQGDSGGPVMVNDKLAGIVSWAYGCARGNRPGVNTNVVKISSWILSFILQ